MTSLSLIYKLSAIYCHHSPNSSTRIPRKLTFSIWKQIFKEKLSFYHGWNEKYQATFSWLIFWATSYQFWFVNWLCFVFQGTGQYKVFCSTCLLDTASHKPIIRNLGYKAKPDNTIITTKQLHILLWWQHKTKPLDIHIISDPLNLNVYTGYIRGLFRK